MNQIVKDWLLNEDIECKGARISRLEWLISITPSSELWIFHGGSITHYLFEEAWYSFVYSQYLATIVLGVAFIEHTLTAMFYASRRNDLKKSKYF